MVLFGGAFFFLCALLLVERYRSLAPCGSLIGKVSCLIGAYFLFLFTTVQ